MISCCPLTNGRYFPLIPANHLTDRVAKSFAETLRENRTLRHLDLSLNEIGEQGAVYLGAGLVNMFFGLLRYNLRTTVEKTYDT